MGRTNPTFRDRLRRYREDWQPFRRGLRAEHKPAFDALFADAEGHADAAGLQNAREPMHAVLVAMLLAQKRQLRALEDRVAALEEGRDGPLDREAGKAGDDGLPDGEEAGDVPTDGPDSQPADGGDAI